ncbi:protein ALP1-like [Malus sylvestris]|uniref:protein ALP1-like n=1 Tax=Malus sylvestris TaxID=3752 RepID=UPI0021AD03BC|nr:protein ALP1-like [Malus sylvestris]
MQFIYVFLGWEGSASDSRVLHDAITRPNGFKVPAGYYYLVDGGYTNGEGFLAPYRGIPYHLSEWEGRTPSNKEEYFNMKHSKARNVIERCFGLLKGRWSILRSPSFYPIRTQGRIITACCLLHNLIRQEMSVDPMENLPIIEDGQNTEEGMDNENILNATQEPKGRRRKWEAFEEEVLLGVLEDFVARKQRCDTGAFKQEK